MSPATASQTCQILGKTVSLSQRSLTKRDIAILRDIATLRFVTAKDIALLHFSPASLTYARTLLGRLAGKKDQQAGEYLYRMLPPRTTSGNAERVYALGSTGAQALTDITGMSVVKYSPSKRKGVSFSFLRHALLVSRIVAAITYFVRTHQGYSLADCRLFYDLSRMQLPETGGGASKSHVLPVIPDVWALLARSDGQESPLWIEADCGTEMRKKFQAYLQARIAFLQSGEYERAFGTHAMRMCFLTTGHLETYKDTRRVALQRFTQEVLAERQLEDWADVFRFAAVGYQELFTSSVFDAALWYCTDSNNRSPLD